jgi:hypothetical protein
MGLLQALSKRDDLNYPRRQQSILVETNVKIEHISNAAIHDTPQLKPIQKAVDTMAFDGKS